MRSTGPLAVSSDHSEISCMASEDRKLVVVFPRKSITCDDFQDAHQGKQLLVAC